MNDQQALSHQQRRAAEEVSATGLALAEALDEYAAALRRKVEAERELTRLLEERARRATA